MANKIKRCSIKGCDREFYARGVCRGHYFQLEDQKERLRMSALKHDAKVKGARVIVGCGNDFFESDHAKDTDKSIDSDRAKDTDKSTNMHTVCEPKKPACRSRKITDKNGN